jgi:hypothetical protein
MSLGYCKVPECKRPVENRDTGLCATHSRAMRKIVSVPIKKVAEKMAKKLDAYAERRRAFLHNKRCAVFPVLKATEIHHKAGRIGKMLLNEKYWLAVSRKGHVEIEMNPAWAEKMGFKISRLTELPKDTI